MAQPKKLTDAQIQEHLAEVKGWEVKEGRLHRELKFADFRTAFSFMTHVALAAEKMDHHPDWYNAYNKVFIDLSTHDCGGISANDFELATMINAAAGE